MASDLFVDAMVTATRTIEHAHQPPKIAALRNAVFNSVAPGAPGADTQAVLFRLLDQFAPSHLRLAALWDDLVAWLTARTLPLPSETGSRAQAAEAVMPELRGRMPFIMVPAAN